MMKVRIGIPFLLLFLLLRITGFSQERTKILLQKADTWAYDAAIGKDVQRLLGKVILSHDSTILYCDSAYLNEGLNNVTAFGNVHIKVSDTLNMFSDSLKYDGNTRVARMKSNVRLIDNETLLTTDTMVYDRNTRIAQYDDWGKIKNNRNNLVSRHGYYHTDTKQFFFKEKVILMNPNYIMHSDTLLYNTVTETSYFLGPSSIKGKEDSIYCENGWYDTRVDRARFRKHAKIFHISQVLTGDSIYYERKTGFGQVFRHAILKDTTRDILLCGNYGELRRAEGRAFMTDSAVAVMIEKKKDSLFIHSDTLRSTFDTADNMKNMFAYYRVKFFRKDLQGKCDSLVYHGADSAMTMYHDPVIWSEKNQLTADSITLTIRNGAPDTMVMYSTAFIISRDDTNKYNQVKGRDMIAYFKDNDIYKIKVIGNSETIYYVREEDKTLIGINKAIASDMLIFLEKNQVKSITYIDQPKATLYPEKEISQYDLKLKGFKWSEEQRPLRKEDIFRWTIKN
jgi:lipopolysaccharide export system protein LptA